MKAAIVPAENSKWEVKEIKMPEPGENQVLIKIRASGMCYTDVHQTRDELSGDFPRTIGHEPVGEIVAVGPGVTTRKTGDRVGVPWVHIPADAANGALAASRCFANNQIKTDPQGTSHKQVPPYMCALMQS